MLLADLLHQLIKGTFKDHLVQWVGDYLYLEHGEARANEILDDIDRRLVPLIFPIEFALKSGKYCGSTNVSRTSPLSSWSPVQAVDRG